MLFILKCRIGKLYILETDLKKINKHLWNVYKCYNDICCNVITIIIFIILNICMLYSQFETKLLNKIIYIIIYYICIL